MTSPDYVTLVLNEYDAQGNPVTRGTATLTPNTPLVDVTDQMDITPYVPQVTFRPGSLPQVKLLATDNANVSPSGWAWTLTFSGVPGNPAARSFFLPFTGGATQYLSDLTTTPSPPPAPGFYLPLPTGTPQAGQVPVATGAGEASAWGAVAGVLLRDRGSIAASTAYSPGDMVAYQGQRVLITTAVTSGAWPNWFTPPTLTAGTYIPVTSQAVYYAADWGVVADGVTDNAPALNRALQFMSKGINSGGFLVLPDGYVTSGTVVGVSSTVIIPPGCYIVGSGMETSCIRANPNMNADVIQFQTNGSASQAAIISAATGASTSAGSLRNAFYAGLMNLCVHGNKANQGASQYNYGVNMTTNPVNTAAGSDPDFDPYNLLFNVEIRNCAGDGFFHSGRSGLRLVNSLSRYNDGWGYSLSFDTLLTGCNTGSNGLGGFYVPHSSCSAAAVKSYNNGQAAQWASGSNYAAKTVVMYSGQLYRAINALANDTVSPASDAVNWAHLSGATAPQYWGYGYAFDSVLEDSWVSCDSQDNAAGDYYLHNCTAIAVQGVAAQSNYQAVSNPGNLAVVTLDGSSGCNVSVAFSDLNSLVYVLKVINGAARCDVRMTGDTSYEGILSPDSTALPGSGNSAVVNGVSLTSTLAAQNDVTISAPSDQQVLAYGSGTSKWGNLSLGSAAFAALASLLQAGNNLSDVANAGAALANLGGFVKQAATPAGGYALVNGTGTIIGWTPPNDGAQHYALILANLHVTSAETGGAVSVLFSLPDGSPGSFSAFAGGSGTGTFRLTSNAQIVEAGSAVSVSQVSALIGGAAVLWAAIFGI